MRVLHNYMGKRRGGIQPPERLGSILVRDTTVVER